MTIDRLLPGISAVVAVLALALVIAGPWLLQPTPPAAGQDAPPALPTETFELPVPGAGEQCVYSAHSIARMQRFAGTVGRTFSCVQIFNDSADTWAAWSEPWFLRAPAADNDWVGWKNAAPGRRLMVSIGMVPTTAPDTWRAEGAAGEFDAQVAALAFALVRAGLGDSTIRIAHEGNGPWFHHWFGKSAAQHTEWVAYWRRIATIMRSTEGARFQFDWTVAPGFDDVDLASYYPGDDVVDLIGFTLHDFTPLAEGWRSPSTGSRFERQVYRRNGPSTIIAFAATHAKPVSVSEWGLVRSQGETRGGDDDPAFVTAMAELIKTIRPTYDVLWIGPSWAPDVMTESPRALAAYRAIFAP